MWGQLRLPSGERWGWGPEGREEQDGEGATREHRQEGNRGSEESRTTPSGGGEVGSARRVCTWSSKGPGEVPCSSAVLVNALGGPVRGLLTAPQIPELQREPPPLPRAAQ